MYYFYFPAAPREPAKGFNIGVAISDSPEGPFMPMFRPIEGIMGIDPCVLNDTDGRSYIYWSGRVMHGTELKENMTELATPPFAFMHLSGNYRIITPQMTEMAEK